MQDPIKLITEYERTFFSILDEFFIRATGSTATAFSTIDNFADTIRSRAQQIAPRSWDAFVWLEEQLRQLYGKNAGEAFRLAKQLGGMKLVLGGGSRFLGSQLNSVSTSILYSDTVFVPDPVMPWLERERTEEKFRHVSLIQNVHALLHIKPLIDANFQNPAVLVFPSMEKILEDKDEYTKDGISHLIGCVFSASLDEKLETLEEVLDYANRNPEKFLSTVDRNHLFVAPGGPVDEPLVDALQRYQVEMETWRSKEWLDIFARIPEHQRVFNGICERLTPQYHLLENAEELGCHPLMCLDQHAHYYKIVATANNARLEKTGLINPRTNALIEALASQRLDWLGDISIDTLIRLREDNENVGFRKRLQDAVGRLHESVLTDIDKVAAEVCHEITIAIAEHEKQQRDIKEKYRRIHGQTAVMAIAATGVGLFPALAPFLATAAPFALMTKYGYDKISECAEKRTLTKSLVGVLATAKSGK
ncbi:hypothetical protein [Geotalea uraniireducens]|uniref:Uncharacterized protein n=1 Tax=Geotalea uraniireducens (strain Rf4) TaxID=351605 RepID=A5GBP0_GEOUR|nr:hypothetical protein [Geotalea uraniireducens]ABQ25000.1 hypothetical protein Gura_0792 [Geotalea uraniireducens Rf4]